MRVLQIHADRAGDVAEIGIYLQRIRSAYNNIYALDLTISTAKGRFGDSARYRFGGGKPKISLRQIREPELVVLPQERLRLRRIQIQSPGFWEFVGALSPLETVRRYLHDRHERKKDRAYRDSLDAERLELENERLRTEVAQGRVELLRQVGVPEDVLRQVVTRHLIQPLAALERFQDSGLIVDAEVIEIEDNPGSNG
jgi:hypothetical protein